MLVSHTHSSIMAHFIDNSSLATLDLSKLSSELSSQFKSLTVKEMNKVKFEINQASRTRGIQNSCILLGSWNIKDGRYDARMPILRDVIKRHANDIEAFQECTWVPANVINQLQLNNADYRCVGGSYPNGNLVFLSHNRKISAVNQINIGQYINHIPTITHRVKIMLPARMLLAKVTCSIHFPPFLLANTHLQRGQDWQLACEILAALELVSDTIGCPIVLTGDLNIRLQTAGDLPPGWSQLVVLDEHRLEKTIDWLLWYNPDVSAGSKIELCHGFVFCATELHNNAGVAEENVPVAEGDRVTLNHPHLVATIKKYASD